MGPHWEVEGCGVTPHPLWLPPPTITSTSSVHRQLFCCNLSNSIFLPPISQNLFSSVHQLPCSSDGDEVVSVNCSFRRLLHALQILQLRVHLGCLDRGSMVAQLCATRPFIGSVSTELLPQLVFIGRDSTKWAHAMVPQ